MKAERAGLHVAVRPFLDKKSEKTVRVMIGLIFIIDLSFALKHHPSAAESFRNSLPCRMLKGGTTSGGQCTCTSNVSRP